MATKRSKPQGRQRTNKAASEAHKAPEPSRDDLFALSRETLERSIRDCDQTMFFILDGAGVTPEQEEAEGEIAVYFFRALQRVYSVRDTLEYALDPRNQCVDVPAEVAP